MKRRSFLAMLGLAPAVAAMPGPGTETAPVFNWTEVRGGFVINDPALVQEAIRAYAGEQLFRDNFTRNNALIVNLKARGKIKDA